MNIASIRFQKATPQQQQDIFQWLIEPHVQEFWDTSPEHKEDILIFMRGRKEASPYHGGIFDYWVGFFENEPYCLLMTSEILPNEKDLLELWRAHLSKVGKTYSVDFMIGNTKFLGKGLGGATLEAFTQFIHEKVDHSVDTFFIDPEVTNLTAQRANEKGGFNKVGIFYRGSDHVLMVKKMSKR